MVKKNSKKDSKRAFLSTSQQLTNEQCSKELSAKSEIEEKNKLSSTKKQVVSSNDPAPELTKSFRFPWLVKAWRRVWDRTPKWIRTPLVVILSLTQFIAALIAYLFAILYAASIFVFSMLLLVGILVFVPSAMTESDYDGVQALGHAWIIVSWITLAVGWFIPLFTGKPHWFLSLTGELAVLIDKTIVFLITPVYKLMVAIFFRQEVIEASATTSSEQGAGEPAVEGDGLEDSDADSSEKDESDCR